MLKRIKILDKINVTQRNNDTVFTDDYQPSTIQTIRTTIGFIRLHVLIHSTITVVGSERRARLRTGMGDRSRVRVAFAPSWYVTNHLSRISKIKWNVFVSLLQTRGVKKNAVYLCLKAVV